MSGPSTPRSSRHSSLGHDASRLNSGSPAVLTPGQKIRAMLAEFDSGSESENERDNTQKPGSWRQDHLEEQHEKVDFFRPSGPLKRANEAVDLDDDEDDLPARPRGRMAARLQAATGNDTLRSSPVQTSQGRHSQPLNTEGPLRQTTISDDDASDDAIPTAGPRRRLFNRKQPSPSQTSERSQSPLFVPMDTTGEKDERGKDRNDSDGSDSDPGPIDRVVALAAQKKKEREERERLEKEKKVQQAHRSSDLGIDFDSDEGNDEDGSGRKLTQQSRPSRKASKKAIMEMNRETQRMSRNMQLAHQATTKKKITMDSFLARFNSKPSTATSAATTGISSATASSPHISDHEVAGRHSTPPTSPLHDSGSDDKLPNDSTEAKQVASHDENIEAVESFPTMDELLARPVITQEAVPEAPSEKTASTLPTKPEPTQSRPIRVRLARESIAQTQHNDSDSDLEIVTSPSKVRMLSLFEKPRGKKGQSSNSLRKLQALAHLTSTSPTGEKQTFHSHAALDAYLLKKAREQAMKEREEKIEELRSRGVYIETAAERAKVDAEVEDLMEKARKEADEIAQKEKRAAKKNGEGKEVVDLDDSEDEDYNGGEEDGGSRSEEGSDEEIESEGEVEGDEEEDDENTQREPEGNLVDDEADESDESNESEDGSTRGDTQIITTEENIPRRKKRAHLVISDDEDEDQPPETPEVSSTKTSQRPQFPNLTKPQTPLMGLTQAFAATMADSQDNTQEDSLAKLRNMPGGDMDVSELLEFDSQEIVPDSQGQNNTGPQLDLFAADTQTVRVADSPFARSVTQYSEAPEPTQDMGFVYSPFDQQKRFLDAPASTVETVPIVRDDSPIVKRGNRRLRRGPAPEFSDADEPDNVPSKPSAFDVMKKKAAKAAKKDAVPFDRTKSKAHEVVDEAAEESEDEYAGLGGASDESAGEEDDFDRNMIDDEGGELADEKVLAALNANHSREKDEQQVNKLLRDITTGALRRKRGAGDDLDLSDSDDERMAARRREKRREFAKMRKALLADEKINKIAEDPKKAAFMRSIEDRDEDFEMDFLYEKGDSVDEGTVSSQDVNPAQENGDDSQQPAGEHGETVNSTANPNKRKRPLEQSGPDVSNRPPPHLRRTAGSGSKKPSTLAEIRESVSFLIDDGREDSFNSVSSLDDPLSDEENTPVPAALDGTTIRSRTATPEPPANNSGTNPRRTRGKVVDRLSLRRAASSNASNALSKQAFYTSAHEPSFKKPPPLLRRATTNASSMSSASTSSSSSGAGAGAGVVKRNSSSDAGAGGKKGAAVNYYAAARERQREWELRKGKNEKNREGTGSAMMQNGVGLGRLLAGGGGKWE